DETGQELQSRLHAAGVLCDFQQSETAPTITKLRVISQHQQLIRVDFEEPFAAQDVESMQQRALAALPATQVLVLSDYAKGALGDTQALIAAARDKGIPVVVD